MQGISRRELLKRATVAAGALAVTRTPGALAFGGTVAPEALTLARVWPRTPSQAAALARFDATHAMFTDGSIELLLWPGDRRRLDRLGIEYSLEHAQSLDGSAPRPAAQPGERTAYRRLNDYVLDMQALATAYPGAARMIQMPLPSLEGRAHFGLEIAADVTKRDGRPVVVIDGLHHAREWPSGELCIMFAYDLLQSYGTDARTTAILDGARIFIVPVQNPDGFNHSREAVVQNENLGGVAGGQEGYWRKNKRGVVGIRDEYAGRGNIDAHGVDPNRNYSFYWSGGGASFDPTSQTYYGASPFSEPESQNIRALITAHQVTAYLTNHTHGRLVMRPWGHTAIPCPDEDLLADLGARMSAFNGYRSIPGIQLYATSGTSRDWAYAITGGLVYTFEHGSAFHPSYLATIPAMYAKNRSAWLELVEAAVDPANHAVITGRITNGEGQPVAGRVDAVKDFTLIAGDDRTRIPERIASSADAEGNFELHLNPSARPASLEDRNTSEPWRIDVTTQSGLDSRAVEIARGQRLDLGLFLGS